MYVLRARLFAALASAFLVGAAFFFQASAPQSNAQAAGSITFSTPTLADADHANGEPDIGIDPQGRVFTSGPTGTGTQRSMWYGSTNGGHTFSQISAGPPPSTITGTTQPPGGGDTELKFDHTGKQYFADLYALACFRTATTTDGGATVAQNIAGGCEGSGPGADRQWISVFDPPNGASHSPYKGPLPLIYMDYNDLGITPPTFFYPNGGSQWNKSLDGLNYVGAIKGQAPGTAAASWAPFGPDGYPAIDQVTGDVFEAAGFQNSSGSWSMLLNIGTPDVNGDLTFLDQANQAPGTVTPTPPDQLLIHVADNLPGSPDTLFSVLSMDTARNLVLVWVAGATPAQKQTYVSAASAASGWTKWTKPTQVSSAPSMVSVFPWIKAGGPGRADAVWYGSNQAVDPSDTTATEAWDVYMAQVVYQVDATGAINTTASPSVTQVKATPWPMHYKSICLAGTNCITQGGNRNLADFFEVSVDASGAAEIAYDDTSNGLIQNGFSPPANATPQLVDHSGAPIVTILRQASGTGVFGRQVSGPSNAPISGIASNRGDARYPLISGSNVPGLDVLSSSITLSNGVLNVRTQIADLSSTGIASAMVRTRSNNLQYVTRWQQGNTIYYAAMETTGGVTSFYAGAAKSVDLCSVSACFPHVITYPEPLVGGNQEAGTINCPSQPSAANPCLLTVQVKVADVGSPTNSTLLREVGAYSFASLVLSGSITNAQAEADNVPLEIDGACCYNTQPPASAPIPSHPADGGGDVQENGGGRGSFTSDEDPTEDGDAQNEQFSDAGHAFQSNTINAVSFDDVAGTMTVTGTGTDNGLPVTFTILELQGGAQVGSYSLVLSDGFSAAGTLMSGAVQLS